MLKKAATFLSDRPCFRMSKSAPAHVTGDVATMAQPGLRTTATVLTPLLRRPPKQPVVLDVACCPGDSDWSCVCAEGRAMHPNKTLATGILRQYVVSEIPHGRKVALPVSLPPGVKLFRLSLPEGEPGASGDAVAISFFDLPVPCPDEVCAGCVGVHGPCLLTPSPFPPVKFPPEPEDEPHDCSDHEPLSWCSVWVPVAVSTARTPPRSCLLVARIHDVDYARMFINITDAGLTYEFAGEGRPPRGLSQGALWVGALTAAAPPQTTCSPGCWAWATWIPGPCERRASTTRAPRLCAWQCTVRPCGARSVAP